MHYSSRFRGERVKDLRKTIDDKVDVKLNASLTGWALVQES